MPVRRRSWFSAAALCLIVLLLASCASQAPMAAGCKPNLNNKAPVVCVSDAGAPDRKQVHAMNHDNQGRPTMIVWIAPGHTLKVEMLQPGCLTQPQIDCQGSVCTGVTLTGAAEGQTCSYKTLIDGVPGTDPDVVIDNCC